MSRKSSGNLSKKKPLLPENLGKSFIKQISASRKRSGTFAINLDFRKSYGAFSVKKSVLPENLFETLFTKPFGTLAIKPWLPNFWNTLQLNHYSERKWSTTLKSLEFPNAFAIGLTREVLAFFWLEAPPKTFLNRARCSWNGLWDMWCWRIKEAAASPSMASIGISATSPSEAMVKAELYAIQQWICSMLQEPGDNANIVIKSLLAS